MANDFYERTFNPLPGQRVDEQVLKDEFQLIEQAFDEVEDEADILAARAIKLPIGTATDQTLALDAVQRAGLVLAFDSSGNVTAISYGRWRDDWLTATAYVISDNFRYAPTGNIYTVIENHTSGVFATDLAANKFRLVFDVATLTTASATAVTAASTATTQAGIATAGGSTATTQAGIATAAAVSAAASYDSFDDRYLGAKTSDPTLDNDGNAILTGALYFNSVAAEMRVYSGSAWAAAYLPAAGYVTLNGVQTLTGKTIDGALNTLLVRTPRVARTSDTALVDADCGKWIDITSGSFTQTFGTRSPGWWCILGNSGTGDVDLTTDGVSYKMYPGEIRRLVYDGTTTYSILIHAYYKVFTASALWYKAPGYLAFAGAVQATGASGDRRATGTSRSGGGGGALAPFRYTADQLSATEGVVIGSPGAANTVNSTPGTAGGNCSFKTTIAQGGRAGGGGAQGALGGYAYSGTTNPMTAGGDEAGTRDTFYGGGGATLSGFYGGTVHGASAGDSISAANARVPAVQSILGPAGGTCNAAGTVITPGAGPGAGGAASTNGTNSGAGMPGEVRIWGEF
jgi:hypothetical protein